MKHFNIGVLIDFSKVDWEKNLKDTLKEESHVEQESPFHPQDPIQWMYMPINWISIFLNTFVSTGQLLYEWKDHNLVHFSML